MCPYTTLSSGALVSLYGQCQLPGGDQRHLERGTLSDWMRRLAILWVGVVMMCALKLCFEYQVEFKVT